MVRRVAGAVRSERVVLLIEVSVLWERTESLIDGPSETRVRQLYGCGTGIGAGSSRQATRIGREIAAQ